MLPVGILRSVYFSHRRFPIGPPRKVLHYIGPRDCLVSGNCDSKRTGDKRWLVERGRPTLAWDVFLERRVSRRVISASSRHGAARPMIAPQRPCLGQTPPQSGKADATSEAHGGNDPLSEDEGVVQLLLGQLALVGVIVMLVPVLAVCSV